MKNLYLFTTTHCLKILTVILLCFPVAAIAQESMRVNLYVVDANGTTLVDGNLTNYNNIYSNAVDINDAWKITNPGINFGIMRDGYDLVVERRSIIARADTTYFKMWNMQRYKYQLQFILSSLDHPGLSAVLRDNYLNSETTINLNGTTDFGFDINADAASINPKRFQLIFKKASSAPVDVRFTSIDAQRNAGNILLQWAVMDEVTVESYVIEHSSDGINYSPIREQSSDNSQSLKTYNYEYVETFAGDNYYRIKAMNSGGRIQYSAVAKVSALSVAGEINVYPNPVENKTLHLQLNNLVEGKYSVALIYSNGFSRQLSSLQFIQGQNNYLVELPKLLAPGVYQVKVTGATGKSFVKSIYVLSE